ncbi:hypothetical protein, partial [Rickettsiella grylli]|uniref:hypothetical protein n=1 Tax=Rickettsiella grylli TaxID=59196 RepID=UPI001C0E352C
GRYYERSTAIKTARPSGRSVRRSTVKAINVAKKMLAKRINPSLYGNHYIEPSDNQSAKIELSPIT